jgi:molecular chaperone DnaK
MVPLGSGIDPYRGLHLHSLTIDGEEYLVIPFPLFYLWTWLSLLGRKQPADQVPRLSPPSNSTPGVLHALGWRKQDTISESEFIYTTDPDPACGQGEPGPILGIDLGTTHSVVAVMHKGKVQIVPNQEGQVVSPSVVAFTEEGEILVGAPAQQRAVRDPRRAVFSIKRLLGRTANEVQTWVDRFACEVVAGPRETPEIHIDGRAYTPVEILACILGKLKDAAERHLNGPARRAVVTVPAFFTDAQRQAVLAAAELAGFDVDWVLKDPRSGHKVRQRMRIISEPTAAALALGSGQRDRRLAVLHMGGGTFDITLLDIGQDVLDVRAVGGDTCLGGDDFDEALVNYLLQRLPAKARGELRLDPVGRQRLRLAAEQAKRDLSHASEVTVDLPWLAHGNAGLRLTVTRPELEKLVRPLVEQCRRLVQEALNDAGLQAKDVDEALIIGGMTRMPRLRQLFADFFPRAVRRVITQDEIVAVGAAIQGEQLLLGSNSELVVLDVAPLTLGLETAAGEFVAMIPRNATIPCLKRKVFAVAADNQPGVSIRVFQEGSGTVGRRRFLGQLDLDSLNGPHTQTKVEVTFDMDHNGILRVTAEDLASGRDKTMRMVPRLPAELLQVRHQVHQHILKVEMLLKDRGRTFSPADQEPLRQLLERSRALARGEDVSAICQAIQELERVRDAMIRDMDGSLGADAPSGLVPRSSFKQSGFDLNLEI